MSHLRAEDDTGAFGILPGHADFLTVLAVSVVTWRDDAAAVSTTSPCAAACSKCATVRRLRSPRPRPCRATICTDWKPRCSPRFRRQTRRGAGGAHRRAAALSGSDAPDRALSSRRRGRRCLAVAPPGSVTEYGVVTSTTAPVEPDIPEPLDEAVRKRRERRDRWAARGRAVDRAESGHDRRARLD